MEASVFSLNPCGKMNGSIMLPLLVTTPNTMMWIGCLVLITISTSCGNRAGQQLFCEFTIWSWQKFFLKNKAYSVRRNLEFVQKLWSMVFPLVLHGQWKKLALSHHVLEISNIFMYCLSDKKLRCSCVPGYGPDWLAEIIINHGVDLIYKFNSSYQNKVRLPSCYIFITPLDTFNLFWILCTILRLTSKHSEIFILELLTWMSGSTECHFKISGEMNFIMVMLFSQSVLDWL